MPRVFVAQKSLGKNLTPALEYGDVVIIFEALESVSDDLLRCMAYARLTMKDFTKNDYIIAMGSPVAMIAVALVAEEKTGGPFKLLEWDKQTFKYRVVQF